MRAKKTLFFFGLALLSAWSIFFLYDSRLEQEAEVTPTLDIPASALNGVTRLVVVRKAPQMESPPNGMFAAPDNRATSTVPKVDVRYFRYDGLYLYYDDADTGNVSLQVESAYAPKLLDAAPEALSDENSKHFVAWVQGDTLTIRYPQVVVEGERNYFHKIHLPYSITSVRTNIADTEISVRGKKQPLHALRVQAPGADVKGNVLALHYRACTEKVEEDNAVNSHSDHRLHVRAENLRKLDAMLTSGAGLNLDVPALQEATLVTSHAADLDLNPIEKLDVVTWRKHSKADEEKLMQPCVP